MVEDFFRSNVIIETTFFDESPRQPKQSPDPFDSGSLDTTLIDGYRQGVELTSQKHWDAGLGKIHAGEPGHLVRKNGFGMSRYNNSDLFFSDDHTLRPQDYITSDEFDDSTLTNLWFDGNIEPLTIRKIVTLSMNDRPIEVHSVKGMFDSANPDSLLKSDRVLTVDDFISDQTRSAFDDNVNMTGNIPMNEYFDFESCQNQPFIDERTVRNAGPNQPSDFITALSLMSGSTENYITHRQRSTTCGWTFENNTVIGTDSITFGGQTH